MGLEHSTFQLPDRIVLLRNQITFRAPVSPSRYTDKDSLDWRSAVRFPYQRHNNLLPASWSLHWPYLLQSTLVHYPGGPLPHIHICNPSHCFLTPCLQLSEQTSEPRSRNG